MWIVSGCEGRVGVLGEGVPPTEVAVSEKGGLRIAQFDCTPRTGAVPLDVSCSWAVIAAPGLSPSCQLDVGADGVTEVTGDCAAVSSHAFALMTSGALPVQLVVQSTSNAERAEAALTLEPSPNLPPQIVQLTATPNDAPAPHDVTLAWALSDPEGDPLTCVIDFEPDGVVDQHLDPCAVDGTAQLTFSTAALRNVTLAVVDPFGNTAQQSVPVMTSQPPTVDLTIARVEWGQSVMEEQMRLVGGKAALLRVHVLSNEANVSGAIVRVNGTLNGADLGAMTLTGPSTVPTALNTAQLEQSYRVILPESWIAPGVQLLLQVDAEGAIPETDEANNVRMLTPTVGAATTLYMTAVPVVSGGVTATIPSTYTTVIYRIWPVMETQSQTRAPYTFSGTLSGSSTSGWSTLLQDIAAVRASDGSSRYYYGWVDVSYNAGIAGIGYVGAPTATGRNDSLQTLVHELGHNFGRQHAPCGTSGDPNYPYANARLGTWGYDLQSKNLVAPTANYDLMSYCNPSWVSDYTYERVQTYLENKPPSALVAQGDEPLMLVAGRIDTDENVELRPVQRLTAPAVRLPDGPYTLRLVRADGSIVDHAFGTEQVDEVDERHFTLLVPDVGPLLGLEVRRGDRVLHARAAPVSSMLPAFAPEIVEKDGALHLRWDARAHPTARVAHVGAARTTLGLWLTGGEATLPLEGLERGGELELGLSDGMNSMTWRRVR